MVTEGEDELILPSRGRQHATLSDPLREWSLTPRPPQAQGHRCSCNL